jgi:hypothetical protein
MTEAMEGAIVAQVIVAWAHEADLARELPAPFELSRRDFNALGAHLSSFVYGIVGPQEPHNMTWLGVPLVIVPNPWEKANG